MADRAIVLRFLGDTTGLRTAFTQAQSMTTSFQAKQAAAASSLYATGSKLQAIGFAASRLTIPFAVAAGASVKMAIDFEDSMSKVTRLADVSEQQAKSWAEELKKLGPELAKSPNELAEALYFVASSGAPVSEAMNIVAISAKASATGMGETKEIADALTSVVNTYGLANIDAAKSADIMTRAVQLGKGEAEDWARVVGRITPVANYLGVGFEEVGAAMAVVTNRGLSASEAATGIRQAMIALQKPTKATTQILAMHGTSMEEIRKIADEQGLLPALQKLKDLAGGNAETFNKFFPNIRGTNAALMLLSEEGAAQTDHIFKEMTDTTGALDESFKKAEETTKFKLNKALAELKTAGIEMGEALTPIVEDIAGWVGTFTDWFTELDDGTKKMFAFGVVGVAALGPVLRVVGNLAKVLSVFVNHPGILALVGLIVVGAWLYENWEPFRNVVDRLKELFSSGEFTSGLKLFGDAMNGTTESTKKSWTELTNFERGMYTTGTAVDEFGNRWAVTKDKIVNAWHNLQDSFWGVGENLHAGFGVLHGWWQGFVDNFWGVGENLRAGIERIKGWWNDLWTEFVSRYHQMGENLRNGVDVIVGWFGSLPGRIRGAVSGAWDGLKDAFKGALNWIIRKWNDISFTFPTVRMFGDTYGGWTLDTPNIPELAKGGIVSKPTIALIGEGGAPEVVFPTNDPDRGYDLLRKAGVGPDGQGSGRAVKIVNYITALDPTEAARKWDRQVAWDMTAAGV